MAIITAAEYGSHTNQTFTGGALTAVSAACAAVDAAVKRRTGQAIEQATYSNVILDAPAHSKFLYLPQWPVSSITSLYLNWDAKADPSLFDATHALVEFTDFRLVKDDVPNSRSKRGKVEILTRSNWAYRTERPLGMLTARHVDCPGAVKATFVAGHSPVPDDLIRAACDAVSLMYARRLNGMPTSSESWNGYSVSWATEYAAAGILNTPQIADTLRFFGPTLTIA